VQVLRGWFKLRYYVKPVTGETRTEALKKLLQAVEKEAQRRMENIDEDDDGGGEEGTRPERSLSQSYKGIETLGQPTKNSEKVVDKGKGKAKEHVASRPGRSGPSKGKGRAQKQEQEQVGIISIGTSEDAESSDDKIPPNPPVEKAPRRPAQKENRVGTSKAGSSTKAADDEGEKKGGRKVKKDEP
jgi:hypothetical protein